MKLKGKLINSICKNLSLIAAFPQIVFKIKFENHVKTLSKKAGQKKICFGRNITLYDIQTEETHLKTSHSLLVPSFGCFIADG